ncbi:MAG: DNA polymerase III subunit delta' [Actinobacteria bacterium]|jgi:DNA polymerase-3 subunit delta'|nr:MAG: DNA polymerase III subunit delta' [Actinomycetota bacterium]
MECSSWEEIYGQSRAVRFLAGVLSKGEVPHALMFTGPRGVGKHSTALLFAAALLCPAGLPDACPSCRKVARGVHPDLHLVEAEGNQILIAQIRELEWDVNIKPKESPRKVIIIDEAERINQDAANAFLKTLEEPPPETYMILVVESREALLPTVVSRCHEVRFSALGKTDIEEFLVEREGIERVEAERIARLSGGIFGRALLWARNPELAAHWTRGVELAASMRRFSLLSLLEKAAEERESLEDTAVPAGENDLDLYVKAMDKRSGEQLRKRWEKRKKREVLKLRRQAALDLFDGMSSFYRDIMLLNLSEEEAGRASRGVPLLNLEWMEELEREALHIGTEESKRRLEALQRARKALEANVDLGLLLDSLVLELKGVMG